MRAGRGHANVGPLSGHDGLGVGFDSGVGSVGSPPAPAASIAESAARSAPTDPTGTASPDAVFGPALAPAEAIRGGDGPNFARAGERFAGRAR